MTTSSVAPPPPPPPPPPPRASRPAELAYYRQTPAPPPPPEAPAAAAVAAPTQALGPMGVAFKLFGIPIRLNLSFLLVGFVLAYGSVRDLPTIALWIGLSTVVILIHELGHAFAFKSIGMDPEITLLGFMGFAYCPNATRQPSRAEEIYVAAAGPAVGLIVAGLCYVLGDTTRAFGPGSWLHVLWIISWYLNLANLLPAFPLDGGRILKSVLEGLAPAWGAMAAHFVSLCIAGGALWWALNNEMEITALILLGIAGTNFTMLRARGVATPQPA